MFVLHVALQGCLRAADVEYGLTADTGGHIRYLLELAAESVRHPAIDRVEIVTRAFSGSEFDRCYAAGIEEGNGRCRIIRLATRNPSYLAKEDLWQEHESFVAALIDHLRSADRLPDLIHAHYADAGLIAARVRDVLGIPFLFTAHSLGRVKRDLLPPESPQLRGIGRRIAIEEEAIALADGIVASSRDEAERQFAVYDGYEPGRIRIIPPGSDLESFRNQTVPDRVRYSIERFLRRPELPVILAIARPVTRKNLSALLHAFGGSQALRARANLVIVAGNRDRIDALEPEISENISEVLELIDRYDLYGSVAYPKHHEPADIAGFYAYAATRRGVFVNPALNEPFGLTLLEAAASGLPLVATHSGGATDIVGEAHNGFLVDPHRPDEIAAAILRIVLDAEGWDRLSENGLHAAESYDWARHVSRYADFAKTLCGADHRKPAARADDRLLLVSDIDGTLIGCRDSVRSFVEWHAEQQHLVFALATGRSFHSALAILGQSGATFPDILIASAGSEIYWLDPNRATYHHDRDWEKQISRGWDRDGISALMRERIALTPQPDLEQRPRKLSYFTEGEEDIFHQVRDLLAEAGHACSVIQSHKRYLDILPLGVSKAAAITHVRQLLGLGWDDVVVAGDSANDVEMLRSVPQAVLVANHADGLRHLPDLSHSYLARTRFARGVMEGVEHFHALRAAR
ncbi:HAD-IIB family hydrolase [Acetobacteraceae bacterium KSS8]|uniref:sucrose-phosphate synthase n=1 Tax=Endosaccharibacter trunci TaxID=2812733 RepID=A0ABT1W9M8_9PROT|nr:HAD-IIB family hydrolase [Acetobacteraceae bacterium KSS8]